MLKPNAEPNQRRRQKRLVPGQPEITFGWEPFAHCVREACPLMAREHAEVQRDARLPFDPDWERLAGWASVGALGIWTVRADATLIGYVSVLFMPHLYSRNVAMANVQTPYLAPEWRNGWLGVEMLETLIATLKEAGVQVVDTEIEVDSPVHKILDRMKFERSEIRRRKWL